MEVLLGLVLLGLIFGNTRVQPASEPTRPWEKPNDLFQPAVDFSPVEPDSAPRAGAPCWVCGKERDGHQHI